MALPITASDRFAQSFRAGSTDGKTRQAVEIEADSLVVSLDEASSSLTYVGRAQVGSSGASAVWRISRLTTTGTVTVEQFADGDKLFDNIWSNRASLTYV